MYDLIGLAGIVVLLIYFLYYRNQYIFSPSLERKLSQWHFGLFLTVQLVAYLFGGIFMGEFFNRAKEFFGYVTISAMGMVLTALCLGYHPMRWLDRTVPLYLTLASMLKLSCFCSGCCYGLPWEWGLYNIRRGEMQFPMQLAEMAAYIVLLWLLSAYRGKAGQRFALFLSSYAAVRFAAQFLRGDLPLFSPFHWMSAVFCGVGMMLYAFLRWYKKFLHIHR